MKLRRIVSFALCLLLLAALSVGCGQGAKDQSQASTSSVSTSSASTTSSTTQEAAPVPDGKLSATPVKLTYLNLNWGTQKADSEPIQRLRQAILDKTNVDIELITENNPSDWAARINVAIAAGDPFDMVYDSAGNNAGGLEVTRLLKEDVIIPLDDLLPANAPDMLKNVAPSTWNCLKYEGKIYGLPGESAKDQWALMYRKDWLEADGLTVPTTIEEYEKVAQDFKDKHKDPGFVSIVDNGLEWFFDGSFIPCPVGDFLDTDGKIKPYYAHKNFKDYLAKMQEWYKKGYINKEFFTMKGDQAGTLVNTAKAGLTGSWADPTALIETLKKTDPKADWTWGPALNSSLQEGVYFRDGGLYDWVGITKSCKNPDIAVKFINWASCTKEGYELTMMGQEGTDWLLKKRDGNDVYYSPNSKLPAEKTYTGSIHGLWDQAFYTHYYTGDKKLSYSDDIATFKHATPVDLGLMYDSSIMKSKDQMPDLNQYLVQEKTKIILGQEPASNWDNIIQTWLGKGGSQYIDDCTEQYNAWKAQQK